tara:strand:+ start:3994 stop:4533 length:540 start_codon:yes stop_codon:yes gene_type:complete
MIKTDNQITRINSGVLQPENTGLINQLVDLSFWKKAIDEKYLDPINQIDSGFFLNSMNLDKGLEINKFVPKIIKLVNMTVKGRINKVERIYWNWYHNNSKTMFHQDSYLENKYSVIYNLHSNDGGTEFKINDKIYFVKAVESQILFFKSNIWHRGVAPTKQKNRYCLNILCYEGEDVRN